MIPPTKTAGFFATALRHPAALGHFLDQPGVIAQAYKPAFIAGAVGSALTTASDVLQAKTPEGKKKIAIQDILVLGSTGLGTVAGVLYFRKLGKKALEPIRPLSAFVTALKEAKGLSPEAQERFLQKRFPWMEPEPEGSFLHQLQHELSHVGEFLGEGAVSVVSGFAGGVLANKINHAPEGSTVKMMKEGIFQYVANIALCGIGAAGALTLLTLKPVKTALQGLGSVGNRLARIGAVSAGLMVGIFGGGHLANAISRHIVDPLFDRWEAQEKAHNGQIPPLPGRGEERKVGWQDLMLHADDIPLAVRFGGAEILAPFIPLFFIISGFKTGNGNETLLERTEKLISKKWNEAETVMKNQVFHGFEQARHTALETYQQASSAARWHVPTNPAALPPQSHRVMRHDA